MEKQIKKLIISDQYYTNKEKLLDDDKYIIKETEDDKKYNVTFKYKQLQGERIIYKIQSVEINEKVFQVFNESRLLIKKAENEFYKKLDTYCDITEITDTMLEVENNIINKVNGEKLRNAIKKLPEIQKRRIIKYYFEDKTFQQIANEENCSKRAVKFSIDIARKELYNKLKNEIQ